MKFVASRLNGCFLMDVLPDTSEPVDSVMAAIAYGANFNNAQNDLISHCLKGRWRLDIWMRYDHTVPVAIPLLKRFLDYHHRNIFLKLVPDCLHSKVIWWRGYGAYIGSANLSERAWNSNIEAGVFMTDDELESAGMIGELERFFDYLRNLDKAFPISKEIIRELEMIESERAGVHNKGKARRTVPEWGGPTSFEPGRARDRYRESFRLEWHDALTTLRSIGETLGGKRPPWMAEDVPVAWQTDQCLHAFYYNKLRGDNNSRPFEEFFEKNKRNPSRATADAVEWWLQQPSAPSDEDTNLYHKAPTIRRLLARESILGLGESQMAQVAAYTHATWDHLTKMKLSVFGITDVQSMSAEERVPIYTAWLMRQRNTLGWSVLQLLNYVLYGGYETDMWERLYVAGREPKYKIAHYGLNSIAEVIGWVRPEVSPPRNGRTSKALRALGYDVMVYQ